MSPLALSLKFLQGQPDSRLLALAREGHEPAFEALVRRYRKELLSYCRRLQPRSGSAEDALQQTLLQAWRALAAGAEVRDFRPWIYRIAHNVTLNNLRVTVAVPDEVPETGDGQEVHQLVEQRLQARAALAGMASLPALQRQVFVSTTLDDASHEEIASALGLSSGAVRGLIYRARATLRAAAAALTPSPALDWAIRRAEVRAGGSSTIIEALAGGGSGGVAGLVVKGGAVLTLAGAVAGGGAILSDSHGHHRQAAPLVRSSGPRRDAPGSAARTSGLASLTPYGAVGARQGAAARASANRNAPSARSAPADLRGRDGGSSRGEREGSRGGTGRGGSSGSDTGSEGGTTSASTSGSSGGSGSGSDGGAASGATISSGRDGGTSGGIGSTTGGLATTTDGSSGSSRSDGGSSGGLDGCGSGDTTTTTPH